MKPKLTFKTFHWYYTYKNIAQIHRVNLRIDKLGSWDFEVMNDSAIQYVSYFQAQKNGKDSKFRIKKMTARAGIGSVLPQCNELKRHEY